VKDDSRYPSKGAVKIFDEPENLFSPSIRWTADGHALVYVATRDGVVLPV
jgi:hypothetical protein